jgi:CBS domain-containing protein
MKKTESLKSGGPRKEKTIMILKDLMTVELENIPATTSLQTAAAMMKVLDVGALPVCDEDEKLVGVITDRDIAIRAVAEGCDPRNTPVSEATTWDVAFCYEDDDVNQAAELMRKRKIRRVLVCDLEDHPVGIVSLSDMARAFNDSFLCGRLLQDISEPTVVYEMRA